VNDLLEIGLSNALAAAVLALIAVAVGAVCRRPALIHGLWLLVLLKLVTPPLARIPVAWPAPTESAAHESLSPGSEAPPMLAEIEERPAPLAAAEQPTRVFVVPDEESDEPSLPAEAAPVAPATAESFPWPRLLLALWPVGSLCWFALALVRLGRFGRLLRFARPVPAALQDRTRRLASCLDLVLCPRVELLPGRIAPMLWAVGGSPRLFLPTDLLDAVDDAQMDTLLVHELAHLRRRDHWVRALEFLVMGLYWWHPVVWYARRALREAEEQCCDAWVVSTLPGAGRTYASALIDTLDFLSTTQPAVPPLASGLGQVADLKRRLTMIMRGTTPRALSWPGCLAVLGVAAFFLPLLPAVQAQAPDKEEAEKKALTRALDDKIGQVQLDDAKKQLAEAEAQLKTQQARLEQARAQLRLAAEQARLQEAEAKKLRRAKVEAERTKPAKELYLRGVLPAQGKEKPTAEDGKKSAIRIEIVISGEGINVEELSKKLSSVLPEKGTTLMIHAPGQRVDIIQRGRARIELDRKATPDKPVPPKPPAPAGERRDKRGAGRPQEDRIDQLEQRMEKLLQELQQLRKEMKKSPRDSTREAPPAPANVLPALAVPPEPPPARR
jgi:beta-lactamase regulating signal transducer with metallopeptidase domain